MFKQHVNTPRYAKDAATKQYVDIALSRIQPGASSSVFDYRVDTQSTSANDPGAGKYKYSTVTQNEATTLYMDWITQDGFDVVALFTTMKFGDSFIIQDKDLSVNYQKWRLLGPATIMPDWFQVPVEFIEGDAVFNNNQLVSFVVTYVGEQGDTGEPGPQGPTGAQGPQGNPGPGVASGGSAGQVLTKVDSTDYTTYWSSIAGGAIIDDTAPAHLNGAFWWESDTGILWLSYNDGNSVQWVQPTGIQGPQGIPGPWTQITQAAYNALSPPNASTLYVIVG